MKNLAKIGCIGVFLSAFICCMPSTSTLIEETDKSLINAAGETISARFNTPVGFERSPVQQNSFGEYLRNLPLKSAGTKVRYYDGSIKHKDVYDAVVDLAIDNKNLQQCADAIIRLRAEHFYAQKAYNKITFALTNGFRTDYSEWMQGNRVVVKGNTTYWQKSANASNTYKDFRNYLNFVFAYAGTLSLDKSLFSKSLKDLTIGDVFIIGGSPGHAVIVVDVAQNPKGEQILLLAQSYMPAQETQILKNPNDRHLSPWYSANITDELITPEWTFKAKHLKGWER